MSNSKCCFTERRHRPTVFLSDLLINDTHAQQTIDARQCWLWRATREQIVQPFAASLEISHEKKDEEGCVIRSSHAMSVQRLGVCLTNKDADAQKKRAVSFIPPFCFFIAILHAPFSFPPILFTALRKLVFHPIVIPTRSSRPRLFTPQPYNIPDSTLTSPIFPTLCQHQYHFYSDLSLRSLLCFLHSSPLLLSYDWNSLKSRSIPAALIIISIKAPASPRLSFPFSRFDLFHSPTYIKHPLSLYLSSFPFVVISDLRAHLTPLSHSPNQFINLKSTMYFALTPTLITLLACLILVSGAITFTTPNDASVWTKGNTYDIVVKNDSKDRVTTWQVNLMLIGGKCSVGDICLTDGVVANIAQGYSTLNKLTFTVPKDLAQHGKVS